MDNNPHQNHVLVRVIGPKPTDLGVLAIMENSTELEARRAMYRFESTFIATGDIRPIKLAIGPRYEFNKCREVVNTPANMAKLRYI